MVGRHLLPPGTQEFRRLFERRFERRFERLFERLFKRRLAELFKRLIAKLFTHLRDEGDTFKKKKKLNEKCTHIYVYAYILPFEENITNVTKPTRCFFFFFFRRLGEGKRSARVNRCLLAYVSSDVHRMCVWGG